MNENVRDIFTLLLSSIPEQGNPISSLYMGFNQLEIFFINGKLLEELPSTFFVVAHHQAS
jgi:hypothetical protein